MRFRPSPFPRRLGELFCYFLIGFLVPVCFVYDVIIVLPAIHEKGSFAYIFTLLMGIFLLMNVEGNLLACMLVDTSVDQLVQPPPEDSAERLKWRHCDLCARLVPPRSWHCKACGVCILKRDHHCSFSGCCIGHRNQRYFFCFVLSFMIITFFALMYSMIYTVMNIHIYWKVVKRCRLIFGCIGDMWIKLQLTIHMLHYVAFIGPILALTYHCPIMLRGAVCPEKQSPLSPYNNGTIRNLRTVFGKRMHLIWLSPLVESELPDDGYTWTLNASKNTE